MESPAHADDRHASEHTEDHLARMSLDGGLGEVRNLLKGHAFLDLNLIAQEAQARATNNSQLWREIGQSEGVCDLGRGLVAESVTNNRIVIGLVYA